MGHTFSSSARTACYSISNATFCIPSRYSASFILPRIYIYDTVEQEETIQDMMERYNIALGSHGDKLQLLRSMMEEYIDIKVNVFESIAKATETTKELEKIALGRNSTLTSVEYIKRLIESEKKSSRPNKEDRFDNLVRFSRVDEVD